MKKLTVIYPAYFPNVETLCQIAAADVVVWGDTFLYKKHDTINRTLIKTVSGPQWLTIPVLTADKKQQTIAEVKIEQNQHWMQKHKRSLEVSYQNSPYYFFLADEIKKLLNSKWNALDELLFDSTIFLCKKMRLKTEIVKSSNLQVVKNRSERVVEWVKSCGCDTYLLRAQDEKFIDREFINKNNCLVDMFVFSHPHYHQLFGEFLTGATGLDLLFNEGELSKSMLQNSRYAREGKIEQIVI